mgnify:CR=1 FL=1
MILKDKFLEHVEYNDHYYGTPTKGATKDKVLIVDPVGANSIYDKEPLSDIAMVSFDSSQENSSNTSKAVTK